MSKDIEKFEKINEFLKKSHDMSEEMAKLEKEAKELYDSEKNKYFKEAYKVLNHAYYEAAMKLLEVNLYISSANIKALNELVTNNEE